MEPIKQISLPQPASPPPPPRIINTEREGGLRYAVIYANHSVIALFDAFSWAKLFVKYSGISSYLEIIDVTTGKKAETNDD